MVLFVALIAIFLPWVVAIFVPFVVVVVEIPLLVECKSMYALIVIEVFVKFVVADVVVTTIVVDTRFVALNFFY